jgi:endonuclease/exonuclease/phosphatase family metal-dependent hydrolase
MQAYITIVSLNILYDPKIDENSPHHFGHRWAAIQEEIKGADIVSLQEVHTGFLERVAEYAKGHGYELLHCLYHVPRQTHLATLVRSPLYVSHAVHSAPGTYSKALSVMIEHEGQSYTVFNVHLPLDIKVVGERLAATKAFLKAAAATRNAVLIGDWNTLPGRGDAQQFEVARAYGELVPWAFGGAPPATFWGFPNEAEELRGYGTPTILDHLFVTPGIEVALAECRHRFVEVDGQRMGISDHMPCHAHLRASPAK